MRKETLDSVTLDVLRHKFWQIAEEMAATIVQTSSSPVVTEVRDFATALFNAKGDLLAMGSNIIAHVAPMQFAIRSVIEECSENPGIREGDAFILNDPHRGAMHQSDVIIAAPYHHQNEIVAWAACHCHELDIGAMVPGGFITGAREIYQEGLRLPPIRFIERGELRKDLWTMLFNHIRIPRVALDLKAQIAATHTGKRRLADMIDRYGVEVVKTAMDQVMDFSEERLRERLRELPNGQFRHIDRQDHDGLDRGIHRIVLTVKKKGDSLTFDFSGTSPQAPGFINCCLGGAWAGVFAVILPWLAYDIPWNAGLMRPVTIVAPEGILCNAALPAPVSKGGVGTMWSIRNATMVTLSKILGCSEKYWQEAMAVWLGACPLPILSGRNQFGEFFSYLIMDGSAGGCGARAIGNGMDSAGNQVSSTLSIPNIETHEAGYPLLYLFRREVKDSPGAGRYRGGAGIEEMMMVYDTDRVHVTLTTTGLEVPNAEGIFGGLPGSCNYWGLVKNGPASENLRARGIPQTIEEFGNQVEDLPGGVPSRWLSRGDMFYFRCTGGGGYGDPLDREPEGVVSDIINGLLSAEQAYQVYGVVVDGRDHRLDAEATRARRESILNERLRLDRHQEMPQQIEGGRTVCRRGEYLEVAEAGGRRFIRCSRCGSSLCPADQNPKAWAIQGEFPLRKAGPLFPTQDHTVCVLRQFYCPGCGVQFEVEVAEKGAGLLEDIQLEV